MVAGRGGRVLRWIGPLIVVVPDVWPFAGQLHVDGLSLPLVRAEVAATILELLQMFDGVGGAGSGHSAHTKWQRHLYVNIHLYTFKRWFELEDSLLSLI